MARRPPTPTNLIDKRTGETHVFPSRGAARSYRQEHGSTNFRTSEYIQRIVRLETSRPGISRTEARGHAKVTQTQAQKPAQYLRGRGARINPTVYGVSSGSNTRSIDATGIRLLREQLAKTASKYVKVSILARWSESGDTYGFLPPPAGEMVTPEGTSYLGTPQWIGRTRDRRQVEAALTLLETEARNKQYGPAEAMNRFAWRMGLAPAVQVSQVTFQEMPG